MANCAAFVKAGKKSPTLPIKKAEVHYLLLLQFIPYCEPVLSKTAALLLIKVVLHIFYILLKLC